MKKPDDSLVQVGNYIGDVMRLAETRSSEIISVAAFGSAAKNGFSQSVSDVDLIVALADGVPRKTKRIIGGELAALELKHKLREQPNSKRELVYARIDEAAGQFKSYFVCYRRELLAGDTAAVFGVNPIAQALLISPHIAFANIVTSARVIWGENFLNKIHIPALSKAHLAKNCIGFLLLNACALLWYPFVPNATKYSMSALKWMLHGCCFCCTLKSATIEEEIDFFQNKVGAGKIFAQLLALRREYQPSLGFIRGCFRVLIKLYLVTVRESKFPIAVKIKQ